MASDLEEKLKKNRLKQTLDVPVSGRGTLNPTDLTEDQRRTLGIPIEPAPGLDQGKTRSDTKETEKNLSDEGRRDHEQIVERKSRSRRLDTRLQLNHLVFEIPPEQINIQHEIKNVAIGVLRAPSTQKVRTGHGFLQITIPLVFTTLAAVNSELVPLLYMLRKTPYCWTENEYLRKTLMPGNHVDAMMLTVQSITVQSVPNLPTTFQAVLQFLWFNYKPYLKEINFRKWYHMNLKMEPYAFGPEAYQGDEYQELAGEYEVLANFVDPTYRTRNRFQNHLDEISAEVDKNKQVILYDYLQEPVRDPRYSESWSEFIRGASENQLNGSEFGPSIAPDKYFRMAWKEYAVFPRGVPKEQEGWELEDPGYAVYSKRHQFNATSEFLPVHASIQFAHRVASLPLLSQQMPTHQYIGPTDREITIVFHCTASGKLLLEHFRNHIEKYEQQVVDYRHITKDAHMEIQTPLAKAAGLVRGGFGYKVIPESIDIETTPGQPGSATVRVTFAEFNPSVYEDPENPFDKEEAIIKTFIASVFNKLSGGNPADILEVKAIGYREDILSDTLGIASFDLKQPKQSKPEVELHLKYAIKEKAKKRGMSIIWNCVDDIVARTQQLPFSEGGPGDPIGFAFATDDEVYGLKSIAELDPYWGGDVSNFDDLKLRAQSLRQRIREVCRDYLLGELADVFPTLSLELTKVNLDLSACYPDMRLPEHPASGRIIDTEPDFYLVNSKLLAEADKDAKIFAEQDVLPAVDRLVQQDRQTAIDNKDEPIEITEPEKGIIYKQGGASDMDNLPAIQTKQYDIGGDMIPKETEVFGKDGFIGNFGQEEILKAGIESMQRHTDLGMRKAFPTFRLYFIKEGRDSVDYSNFYEARGGFAVKEIRVVRSRKIPTDTLVVDMVNLDGFLETDDITDIRTDSLQTKQSRYTADNRELFYKYDDQIKSQLGIHNALFGSNLSFYLIKKIMEGVTDDPAAGEYGPLGTTIRHAELVDGQRYSPDQLSDPVTSIRIGTFLLSRIAFQMRDYQEEARFSEVVSSLYKFPELNDDIQKAVAADFNKNGLITSNWYKSVRNNELAKLAIGIRSQESSESAVRKGILDKDIKEEEKKVEDIEGDIKATEQIREEGSRKKGLLARLRSLLDVSTKRLKGLKKDREANLVREPVSKGIIFKEGTDIVLKMGYSNNPEKLEVVFIGHVTEAQPGPGTLQIVAQSFATELMQEIKGTKDGDATMRGASDPTRIANWIMSFPEVKHFGRWDDAQEVIEDQRNIRGIWYKKWNWSNNPSDDNIYLIDRDTPYMTQKQYDFTLNGRTLWQGMMDLALMFPGYVFDVRPYLDLDKKGRRRWRNTMFLGAPDMTYLSRVPDDWKKIRFELKKMEDRLEASGMGFIDPIAENAIETYQDRWAQQRLLNERNVLIKDSQSMRRESFRRYHMLSSYTDIIDNGIILTKRDVYNGIKLRGRTANLAVPKLLLPDGEWVERQLDGMDESHINWLYVENDNAYKERAQRMATSVLMTSLRDIYDGEITILGNPMIQPYDVCFLNDFYNDMSGPFEVEQVVHTFSESTGFITQLKPDLFTSIAETAQRTAMGAMGAYAYRTVLNKMGIRWDSSGDELLAGFIRGDTAKMITQVGGVATIGALAYSFPLYMAPVLLASYFIGGYLKDHAIIRVVPLFHKGIPFVTGLEGFRAPATSDALLNQFRIMRKSFSEGVDAVSSLWADFHNPNRNRAVIRSVTGW